MAVTPQFDPVTGTWGYYVNGNELPPAYSEGPSVATYEQVWVPMIGPTTSTGMTQNLHDDLMSSLNTDEKYQLAQQIDPSKAASDPRGTQAELIRASYADAQARFMPLEDMLKTFTTYNGNKGVVDSLNEASKKGVDSTFNTMQGMQSRTQQRLGMAPDAATEQAQSRDMGLNKTLATVDAQNRNEMFQQDLNRQVVSGSGMAAQKKFIGG